MLSHRRLWKKISNLSRGQSITIGCGSKHVTTISSIFQPINLPPKDSLSKKDAANSQKLLFELGFIQQASPGMFTFLPLGLRVLNKLQKIIDNELHQIGCQKVTLPTLTSGELWKTTGRWESTGPELLTIKDRHGRPYVLSPTHEEAITELVASLPSLTYKQMPLRLYQMTSKFRDEIKPRLGLLRGREFIMKDLYTFDVSVEQAEETYNAVCQAYDKIFQQLEVKFVKVVGATGNIGGLSSHEYHFPCAIGEDRLKTCTECLYGTNAEVSDSATCVQCGSPMIETKGIEVGHTFLLGTKYSQVLKAMFSTENGTRSVCQMGCYGIGVSRIIAAIVEMLAKDGEIRWPKSIAPYSVYVIAPKMGSKEENAASMAHYFAHNIGEMPHFCNDVLFDDRPSLTIGKKLMEAKKTGYPYIIVVGKKSLDFLPKYELHDLTKNLKLELSGLEIFQYLRTHPQRT